MKHTPAPWIANEENCGDGLNIRDEQGRMIAHTATTRNPDYTPLITEEAIANARLIAAAPELLDTLKILLDALSRNGGNDRVAVYARAIIKKATGE